MKDCSKDSLFLLFSSIFYINQLKYLSFKFLMLFVFFAGTKISANNYTQDKGSDSITYYINYSKNKKNPLNTKLLYLKKAYAYLNNFPDDSLKCRKLSAIAYRYYKLSDTLQFKKTNKQAYQLALKIKDSFSIADTHWNYAFFYKKLEIYNKSFYHYNTAYHYFDKLNKTYESARMLFSMAFIKGRYRDYKASEILTFQAIKKFKQINNNQYLYSTYNHLGLLQNDIKEYDKALFYYNKSLIYFNENKLKKYLGSYNNMANIYFEKKEYKKALKFYNKELIKKTGIVNYARVLNNRAMCKLLMKDTFGIKEDFYKALKIRDSSKNKAAIVNSKINISDYYKYLKDTVTAFKYAKEANLLAKEIKNGGDYLTTLKHLADLDLKNSKQYLDRYIAFNDSLITTERRTQNKFTRIEFETDEYIEETEKLTQQNLVLTISSIGTILVLSLLYFIRVQKVKNEKLRLETEQQKANEEVYVLTLQQQAKLEKERVNERNRISAELHDGILGKLFGTRVNLGFLGMKMTTDTQEKHQAFLDELQVIEKEIREVSHKLSDNFDDTSIGFYSIITQLLKDKSIVGNFTYALTQSEEVSWNEIDEIKKANIYRIIQEALQNIIKHAKAKKIILDFSIFNEQLVITLKDDGIGFNTIKSKKGIGLKNITSRTKKLNGTLKLISEATKGTTLTINIPYKTNEH